MLHVTSYWKNAFQSFMSTPGFEYRPKQIKSSKIANIKKSPLNADNICNIEVMVIKKKSNKRTADGEEKGGFCLVGDGSAMVWFRSKFDLEEKIWYEITNVKSKMLNDELVLMASHNAYKQIAQKTDVRNERFLSRHSPSD